MTGSMDSLTPAERVLSAGRSDAVAYRNTIVQSTATRHGSGIEAALIVVCGKFRALNDTYVNYLRNGGSPRRQNRSRSWGEAEYAYTGALETVSALFGVLYPKIDGTPPITEVEALIKYRVGPLCTGWMDSDTLVHHSHDDCPQHPQPQRPPEDT